MVEADTNEVVMETMLDRPLIFEVVVEAVVVVVVVVLVANQINKVKGLFVLS
jgi:hypothetical protein